LVAAVHGPDLRGQHCSAGIFKTLIGFKQGLLTHHTLSAHILHMIVRIGNNPWRLISLAELLPRLDMVIV